MQQKEVWLLKFVSYIELSPVERTQSWMKSILFLFLVIFFYKFVFDKWSRCRVAISSCAPDRLEPAVCTTVLLGFDALS